MEDLLIINYSTSTIHLYKVSNDTKIDDSYIEELGFNLDECYYMCCEHININIHNEILK